MKPSVSTIASVGIGVPVATVASWVVSQFAGVDVPGPVEAAFGAIISALIGYFFPGGQAADTKEQP